MENNTFVSEYQIAIFPTDFTIEKVGEVAAKLMKLTDDFDPDSVVMNPFDMSFSPEIERVGILSADKKIKLSVSPKKLVFFWINVDLENNFVFNEEKSITLIKKVINTLGINKLTIQRVGFITNFIKRDSDPSKLIKEYLLKNPIQNEITNTQLILTYRTSLKVNNKCNLHVTIASGYLNDNKEDTVASILFDVNTHQDEILSWKMEEVEEFITQAKDISKKEVVFSAFFSNKDHGTTI